jgi:hypothetical protein
MWADGHFRNVEHSDNRTASYAIILNPAAMDVNAGFSVTPLVISFNQGIECCS